MKRPNKVLAMPRVDPGLAAHRTIDLRQQRRRDLHKPHAPPQDRSRKANKIPDHAAAKSHDHIAALNFMIQQPFDTCLNMRP